ncbi:two-component system histidine kinase PnpS [Listeria booriae]|uniref:histidine kinase n=1 Tax=Listeria booriae TaxID=1552123 RepID=A0A7X0WEZ5_9LIST|nr:ATP-binding protein [Listeria booriae]MBC1332598.1 cell wall metabolism sensor histidine kinase WalK [Listeria booriae]MBC2387998.1 cell wall metabolism sensor histidine kinase WalK [Listeria booriae]
MKKLWLRIGLSFFILFFVVMVVVGFFSGELMRGVYLHMKESQLQDDAKILLTTTKLEDIDLDKNADQIQADLKPLEDKIGARITVIDQSGRVVADTKEDPHSLPNHMDRPEVQEVLKDGKDVGIAIRKSSTLGYSMLYVAVPITHNGVTDGVLRISISLESVENAVHQLWLSLALIFGLALVFIGFISFFISRRITRPVNEIIDVSMDLANNRYYSRITGKTTGELHDLSLSVNQLAQSLEKQMQEIELNQQRLSGIVQNLVSGVMLINQRKQIVMTNPMMEQIIGEKDMTGKAYYEVLKSFALTQLVDQCMDQKTFQQEEITIYFPREQILDANVSPILSRTGSITGVIVLLHDITEIRRLENVRSEFVANVSHELKTPVTALKGFAETLLDGAMYDEELLKKFLTIIKEESDRLHRLIMDILELSRIEQRHVSMNLEEVDVEDVVIATMDTVRALAVEKGIQLIPPNLAAPIMIQAERDRLQQILINLISNAIVYTPQNGEVSVGVTENAANETVTITVTDNGIGIPVKDIDRIFERFYRVDRARSRHSGGTGLGLSIVKHIVESCGGQINVESIEGEGTTFTVILPR